MSRIEQLPLSQVLPVDVASSLALNLPKEDYDVIGIRKSIIIRQQIAERLHPYINRLWENPSTKFVVVDDREVHTTSELLEDIDIAGLYRSSSTWPLLLERPADPSLPASLVIEQCLLEDTLL